MENKYNNQEKQNFIEWLNRFLKEEYKTERFYNGAWQEAIDANENGMSYELPSMYAIGNRPYTYKIS